jgi:hypothetical protein
LPDGFNKNTGHISWKLGERTVHNVHLNV